MKNAEIQAMGIAEIRSLVITHDLKYIVAGSADRSIKVFDLEKMFEESHACLLHTFHQIGSIIFLLL